MTYAHGTVRVAATSHGLSSAALGYLILYGNIIRISVPGSESAHPAAEREPLTEPYSILHHPEVVPMEASQPYYDLRSNGGVGSYNGNLTLG